MCVGEIRGGSHLPSMEATSPFLHEFTVVRQTFPGSHSLHRREPSTDSRVDLKSHLLSQWIVLELVQESGWGITYRTEMFQWQLHHQSRIDDSHKTLCTLHSLQAARQFGECPFQCSQFQKGLLASASSSELALSKSDPIWLCRGFSGWLFCWLCHAWWPGDIPEKQG